MKHFIYFFFFGGGGGLINNLKGNSHVCTDNIGVGSWLNKYNEVTIEYDYL